MKKFADYFEDAIKYGESLGLRNDSEFYEDCVKLDSPSLRTINVKLPFYPVFVTIWKNGSFAIEDPYVLGSLDVTDAQRLRLIKLFAAGYENYLADKKSPSTTQEPLAKEIKDSKITSGVINADKFNYINIGKN